jgi:hypothetical protein
MALARVVSFQGVSEERIADLRREIEGGEQPEGMNATEMLLLHDPGAEESVAVLFFETEEDYRQADEVLNAMPAGDTPGSRTAVRKYTVAAHVTAAHSA